LPSERKTIPGLRRCPRIVIEVKHRKGAMGGQQTYSFLLGRHEDDKGLDVSTSDG